MGSPESPLPCIAFNHVNITVDSLTDTVDYFKDVHGAQLVLDIPIPEWHACVLYFGGILAELFEPAGGLLNARYGAHYLGLEYQISPSLDFAREVLAQRDIRIARDIGKAVHTDPRDTYGIAMELCEVNLHELPLMDAYGQPLSISWLEPWHPAPYWRNEHPLGAIGMKHCTVSVTDLVGATGFFESLFGAVELDRPDRRAINADAIQLGLADTVLEFQAPTGPGPLADHLNRYGDGIRSIVVQVASVQRASEHLDRLGVPTTVGDSEDTIATDAAPTGGVRIDFSE